MTPVRQGSDHGRGGQDGHEPRATVQAREVRVLDWSVAGLSQRQIAAEEGITQSAVSKILARVEARVLEDLVARVEQQKVRQTLCLDHLYRESLQAWEASKADATRQVQKKTTPGLGVPGTTVAQIVSASQHGDPRYLEVARKALADQRRVWGLEAPQKLDVRATEGLFDAMSDEALAEALTHQRQLLDSLDAATDTDVPREGDGEVEDE